MRVTALERPIEIWEDRQVRAMGSPARIILGDGPAGLLDWSLSELKRLEGTWSRFRPDSELVDLNASAGRWFPMSPVLATAVDRAIELHRVTDGLFDPTGHDRLVALGYDRTFRAVDPASDRPAPTGAAFPGVDGIERDGDHIRLPVGVRLDLGGVGKGLAADLLTAGLLERGARSACVSLGGDIRARGVTPGDGWAIPVQDPLDPSAVWGSVSLSDAAIVTSTTRIRTWRRAGVALHHLLDPRTGDPSRSGVVAAVVVGPDASLAEGVAKAALIAGADDGVRLLDRLELGGWLVAADGAVFASSRAPSIQEDAS